MAVLSSGNRVLYIRRQEDLSLDFTVRGTLFPNWATPGNANQLTSRITFESTSPNKIYVNWGDGSTDSYDFVFVSANVYRIRFSRRLQNTPPIPYSEAYDAPLHYYQDLGSATGTVDDNLDVRRIVSFSFDVPENVSSITSHLNRFYDTLPVGLGALRSLEGLDIAYCYNVDRVPASLFRTNIKNLRLSSIGEAYRLAIPEWVLQSPLVSLDIGGND